MPKFKPYNKLSSRHKRRIKHNKNVYLSEASHHANEGKKLLSLSESDEDEIKTNVENVKLKSPEIISNRVIASSLALKDVLSIENERLDVPNESKNSEKNTEDVLDTLMSSLDRHGETDLQRDVSMIDESSKLVPRTLEADIAKWACIRNYDHDGVNELLGIINYHIENNSIPKSKLHKCAKTILKTPRKTHIIKMDPGHYVHFELETYLFEFVEFNFGKSNIIRHVDLQVNIDGLPIFASNKKAFWPILCRILGDKNVFLLGCFCGEDKPHPNDFIQYFVYP